MLLDRLGGGIVHWQARGGSRARPRALPGVAAAIRRLSALALRVCHRGDHVRSVIADGRPQCHVALQQTHRADATRNSPALANSQVPFRPRRLPQWLRRSVSAVATAIRLGGGAFVGAAIGAGTGALTARYPMQAPGRRIAREPAICGSRLAMNASGMRAAKYKRPAASGRDGIEPDQESSAVPNSPSLREPRPSRPPAKLIVMAWDLR